MFERIYSQFFCVKLRKLLAQARFFLRRGGLFPKTISAFKFKTTRMKRSKHFYKTPSSTLNTDWTNYYFLLEPSTPPKESDCTRFQRFREVSAAGKGSCDQLKLKYFNVK